MSREHSMDGLSGADSSVLERKFQRLGQTVDTGREGSSLTDQVQPGGPSRPRSQRTPMRRLLIALAVVSCCCAALSAEALAATPFGFNDNSVSWGQLAA